MIDDLRLDQELDRPGPKGRIQHVEQGLTARVAGDLGPEGSLLLGVSLGSRISLRRNIQGTAAKQLGQFLCSEGPRGETTALAAKHLFRLFRRGSKAAA